MKFLEKLTSKAVKDTSTAVKEEIQSTTFDILPTLFGIGGLIFGAFLFKQHNDPGSDTGRMALPKCSTITITTNNYYFGDNFCNQGDKED